MIIFTRGKDINKYINLHLDITTWVIEDFSRCLNVAGIDVSVEEIFDSYYQALTSPNTIESILIREGKLTEDEVKRNYLMETVFKDLEYRWNSK